MVYGRALSGRGRHRQGHLTRSNPILLPCAAGSVWFVIEHGLRMLTLPVAEQAAALNILRGYYPHAICRMTTAH